MSRRLDLLERDLGTTLFERTRTGVRLTDAGDAFLPFANQVLATVRDGAAAVQALASGEAGTITLALVGTLASTALTGKLKAFRERHPQVRLRLRTARSDEVSLLVQTGEVELGLRYFPDPSASINSRHVANEDLVVACASDAPISELPGDSLLPALGGMVWVAFPAGARSSGESFRHLLEQQLTKAGLADAEMIEIDSLTAQKRLIEAGFGVGLLPVSSLVEEVRLGTLRILPIDELTATAPVYVIQRRDGYLGPAAERLLLELSSASL